MVEFRFSSESCNRIDEGHILKGYSEQYIGPVQKLDFLLNIASLPREFPKTWHFPRCNGFVSPWWFLQINPAMRKWNFGQCMCVSHAIRFSYPYSFNKENKIFSRSEIHISRETHLTRKNVTPWFPWVHETLQTPASFTNLREHFLEKSCLLRAYSCHWTTLNSTTDHTKQIHLADCQLLNRHVLNSTRINHGAKS